VHEVKPADACNFPTKQLSQLVDAMETWNVPAAQAVHWEEEVAPEEVPYLPATQLVQLDEPVELW